MSAQEQVFTSLRKTFHGSPELFFPVAILIVWQALNVLPSPGGLWVDTLLAALLCFYGSRVLGTTQWMRRLGWIQSAAVFWAWSASAGLVCAFAVLGIARATGKPLGTVHSVHLLLLASTAGPILEELLFRGLLYWVFHKALRHFGVPNVILYPACVVALAVLFAFAHAGNDRVHLWSAIGTGIAFGTMRVISGSTACAALMHGSYNFTLCSLALLWC